jgi:predicted transposase/invertase (TIGR01784 family)
MLTTATRFCDPKEDLMFKRLFGSEQNRDILIHFLNDILREVINVPIDQATFCETFPEPNGIPDGQTIIDSVCTDIEGNQYIIELQVARLPDFTQYALYRANLAYASQPVHRVKSDVSCKKGENGSSR